MKKVLSVILTGGMVFSLSAYGQTVAASNKVNTKNYEQNVIAGKTINTQNILRADKDESRHIWQLARNFDFARESIDGGWNRADSPVITSDVKKLVDKAVENIEGARYIPVAYIGSQVVAGTNHCVLCKIAPVVPGSVETYAIVYLYEDLEGNVEITDIIGSDIETYADTSDKVGGWNETESPVVTEDVQNVIEKATEGLVGASYTPVAYLANQIVSGMNYCILCEVDVIYPGTEPSYSIVHVYKDLEGNAEITEIFDFVPSNS